MCGIFAALSFGPILNPEPLLSGLATLSSRGPDGSEHWFDPEQKLMLGHVRLAIRDLTGGKQPLHSSDGHLHAVVNGELYGYTELRHSMEQQGYVFTTHSDSELVLALYQVYGLDFVQHLAGEFAILLWDGERLIAVRDRFGIKPLCYARQDEGIVFASKAQALLAAGISSRWNLDALYQSFSLQYVLPEQSLFEGIEQVAPGHMLQIWPDGGLKKHCYWDLDYPQEHALDPNIDAAEILSSKLSQAVTERLAADVPICSHLSGGIDSTVIMHLMAQKRSDLTAFSISFPEHPDYDEIALARASAISAGVTLHEVPVTVAAIIQNMPRTVALTEGLAINGHVVAKRLLNQVIHQAGFKVALTGEGADELLFGYAHFRQELGLKNNNPLIDGIHLAQGPQIPLGAIQQGLGFVPAFLQAKASLGARIHQLLKPEHLPHPEQPAQALCNSLRMAQLQGRHKVHQAAWIWSKLALANYILHTVGDGTEMAHSIEGRLPYLDHQLFEALRRLPPEQHFSSQLEKVHLRKAFHQALLPQLRERPKHPFTAPPLTLYPAWRAYLKSQFTEQGPVPWLNLEALLKRLQDLETAPEAEHRYWDPALNILLTATLLQSHFGLV